jgi:hypothetical protein
MDYDDYDEDVARDEEAVAEGEDGMTRLAREAATESRSRGGGAVAGASAVADHSYVEDTTELQTSFDALSRARGDFDHDAVSIMVKTSETERARVKFAATLGEVMSRFDPPARMTTNIKSEYDSAAAAYPEIIEMNPAVIVVVFYIIKMGNIGMKQIITTAKEQLSMNPADIIRYYKFFTQVVRIKK